MIMHLHTQVLSGIWISQVTNVPRETYLKHTLELLFCTQLLQQYLKFWCTKMNLPMKGCVLHGRRADS